MKVLVTGGAGFIGSHTDVELLKAGYDVVVVDNFYNSSKEVIKRVEKLTNKTVSLYEVDLCNKEKLEEVFQKENIDAVIHFAALKAVGESCEKPLLYFENNIVGTLNLLSLMQKYGVKKFVYSSSATVYGIPKEVPIREDAELSVLSPYGRTKLMTEEMLRDIAKVDPSFNIMILRYFNPIGAHESGEIGESPNGIPNNLVPYIAKVATGELPFVSVFGNDYETKDGTGVRDYIHVVDLAIGHIKAIERLSANKGLEEVNLGTGVGYSVLEVIKSYEKACGRELPYVIKDRRAGDAAMCYADPTKAKEVLGWSAMFGIEKMCEDSYRWQSKYPKGYEE